MIIAAAVWVGAFLYFALGLAASRALGDFECPDSVAFSTYGSASWQWWPPGVRCAYPGGDPTGHPAGVVSAPTSNAVCLGILVATFGGLVLAELRHRRSGARRSGGSS